MKKLNEVLFAVTLVAFLATLGVSTLLGEDVREQLQALAATGQAETWPESALIDWTLWLLLATFFFALAWQVTEWRLRKKSQLP